MDGGKLNPPATIDKSMIWRYYGGNSVVTQSKLNQLFVLSERARSGNRYEEIRYRISRKTLAYRFKQALLEFERTQAGTYYYKFGVHSPYDDLEALKQAYKERYGEIDYGKNEVNAIIGFLLLPVLTKAVVSSVDILF